METIGLFAGIIGCIFAMVALEQLAKLRRTVQLLMQDVDALSGRTGIGFARVDDRLVDIEDACPDARKRRARVKA